MSPRRPPRVLIVGGGPFQVDLIAAAKRMGTRVAVVDRNPDAPGMALADDPVVADIIALDAVVNAARGLGVRAVLTAASDAAVFAVAAVAEALDLPGLPLAVARTCRDKLATYEALRAAGCAAPHTVEVADPGAARSSLSEVGGLPAVIKPSSGGGGRGVSVVETEAALPAALEKARGGGKARALLQRFVPGRPVGVEAFFVDGELAAAFIMDDQFRPGFVSPIGHALPSTLPSAERAAVLRDVQAFGAALGLNDGPANFDLRRHEGRTWMLEVNPRLGGSSITQLVRAAHQVDLSAAALTAALGRDPAPLLIPRTELPVASRLLVARGRGPVRYGGDPAAERAGGAVLVARLDAPTGAPAPLGVDEWSLLGAVMVRAADVPAAVEHAAELAAAIEQEIEVEP